MIIILVISIMYFCGIGIGTWYWYQKAIRSGSPRWFFGEEINTCMELLTYCFLLSTTWPALLFCQVLESGKKLS